MQLSKIRTQLINGEWQATLYGYENVAYGPTAGTARDNLTREIRRMGSIKRIICPAKREIIPHQFASANRGTRAPYRGTGTMPKPR